MAKALIYNEFLKHAKKNPKKIMLKYEADSWSYKQSLDISNNIADNLLNLGIKKGDVICAIFKNRPEALFIYLACFKIGAILVPINIGLNIDRINTIIRKTSPKLLFIGCNTAKKYPELISEKAKYLKILLGKKASEHQYHLDNFISPIKNNKKIKYPKVKPKDICIMFFSSGSTGEPKGILHPHKNMYISGMICTSKVKIKQTSKILLSRHITYAGGFNEIFNTLFAGCTLIIPKELNIKSIIKNINKFKVTHTAIDPILFSEFLHYKIKKTDNFSYIKEISSGGGSIFKKDILKFQKKYNIKINIRYGMSEIFPITYSTNYNKNNCGSVGKIVNGVKFKIINSKNKVIKNNTQGQLIIKAKHIMTGYLNNKKANKKAFKNGWFYTGDIVKQDKQGCIWLVDRLNNKIIRGAHNIYPSQLENIIIKSDLIKNICTTSFLDNKNITQITMFIVPKDKSDKSDKNNKKLIKDYIKKHIAEMDRPDKVIFLKEFPKLVTGKVDKVSLTEKAKKLKS